MSEFPLSSTEECPKRKKTGFSSLLLCDLHLLCSFILSHPLYFSYLLFFSPYIVKVLSFLSPLFVTTTLLLLALLSTLYVHDASDLESSETQPSLLFSVYRKLGGVLHSKFDVKDDESVSLEELEVYKMVFEACPSEMGDVLEQDCEEACTAMELMFVDKFCSHESTKTTTTKYETSMEDSNEKPVEIPLSKIDELMNLEEEEEEETKKREKEREEEEEVKQANVVVSNKGEGQIGKLPTRRESKATRGFSNKVHPTHAEKVASQDEDGSIDADDYDNDLPRLSDFLGKISANSGEKEDAVSQNIKQENNTLGSFGSMRKEKEWRRTLACKLFEERHKADVGDRGGGGGDGGEGMDLLWETYETEADNVSRRRSEEAAHMEKEKRKMMMKMKNKKKSINERNKESSDDGDDDGDGQLCCLQALKFSTGKMHLGMGRPNLLKISKAIKGIGWFHNVAKHGRKP